MKRLLAISLVTVSSFALASCSSTPKEYSINSESNATANGIGVSTITGTATPKKYVKIGINATRVNNNGKFKLKYTLPNTKTTTVKIRMIDNEYDSKSLATKNIKINSAYDSIKLGMTKEAVTKILGKPTSQSSNVMYYGTQSLSFIDDKLTSGTPSQLAPQISSSVSESIKNKVKEEPTEQQKQAKNQEKIKSFARTFGNKPAQEIQEKSYTYSSSSVDGLGIVYMWKNDFGTLMRIDGSDNITSVYLYDPNAKQGKGKLLYQGHTIINKQKKQYTFYN